MPEFCSTRMGYLQNIEWLSGHDNLGGLIDLKVIRKSDVLSIPDPINGEVYGNITFKPGVTGFSTWKATLESPNLQSRGLQTREGEKKETRLRVVIPKDIRAIRAMLELATQDEFILLYTDGSGQQKLVGQLHAPMRFSFDHNTGTRFSDGNFYEGVFYYNGPDNTFFYSGTGGSSPVGAAPAIVRFNGSVIGLLQPGEELNITSDYSLTEYFTIS